MSSLNVSLYQGSKTLLGKIPTPKVLRSLEHGESVPAGCGVIRVMTIEDGDKRFAWNPRSIPEINEAHDFFTACVAEGLVPYKVGVGGKASAEIMSEFDPSAGEIILLPIKAVVGG